MYNVKWKIVQFGYGWQATIASGSNVTKAENIESARMHVESILRDNFKLNSNEEYVIDIEESYLSPP